MPHKAVAESVTPPNRILLTCNCVHNALVSHGKRRRDFSYCNMRGADRVSVKIKITNKTNTMFLWPKHSGVLKGSKIIG